MKTSIDSTSLVNSQHEGSESLLISNSDAPTPIVHDHLDSPLTNIKYGVGMLAFIAIPPLIPGVTTRSIIIGFMCVIVSIYTAAGIVVAIRAHHPARRRKMA